MTSEECLDVEDGYNYCSNCNEYRTKNLKAFLNHIGKCGR